MCGVIKIYDWVIFIYTKVFLNNLIALIHLSGNVKIEIFFCLKALSFGV